MDPEDGRRFRQIFVARQHDPHQRPLRLRHHGRVQIGEGVAVEVVHQQGEALME